MDLVGRDKWTSTTCVHESVCPYCGKKRPLFCAWWRSGEFVNVCASGLEDRSKQLQAFEELPGSFLLCLWAWSGMWRVKECTDVLSDAPVFELSTQRRNLNPNTWALDYRLMPRLDLRSQSTKDKMNQKPGIPNAAVFSLIQSRVRQQMSLMFD